MISFDDFKKVDIRVGKIVSVEEVLETDKLLKLMVDFGLKLSVPAESSSDTLETDPEVKPLVTSGGEERDIRQIVSGIKDRVGDPQSLVGMKTTFVVNLEPRTIKGLESNGMLFAVGDGDTFTFLVPQRDVPPGTGTK